MAHPVKTAEVKVVLHFSVGFDVTLYGYHHLVVDSAGQVQVVRDALHKGDSGVIVQLNSINYPIHISTG